MATGEIDNLVISVTSSANEATRALSRVRDAMRGVQGAADDASGSTGVMSDQMEHVAGGSQRAHIHLSGFLARVKSLGGPLKSIGSKVAQFGKSLSFKIGSGLMQLPKYFGGRLVDSVENSVKSLGTFFNSLKRIAFYRAIRTALKLITQGFSEGIENLYRWSVLVDNRFAKSMDTIATAGQYLKNSLAAMVSPLINAIAPAIDFVVDKLVNVFNAVNQVIARLTGATTYTAAKKVATVWKDTSEDVADKTKTAAKNAKETNDELKRTILGFDEINKLDKQSEPNTGTSSPGAGTGNGDGKKTDYASMFETRNIDSKLANFADQIRKAVQAQDWKGLGTLLGNKVNSLVNSIDFAKAGAKVGKYINAWFSTKYWTLSTINFTNIGAKIATFLNNAISQIDFGIIGAYLVRRVTMVFDLLIGFITTFDWGQAAAAFSAFVTGMFLEITKWFNSHDWKELGGIIWQKIKDIFTNLDYAGIASTFFEMLGTAIGAAAKLLGGFFGSIVSDIKDWWNNDIKGENWADTAGNLLAAIGEGFANIGQWVFENIVDPFCTALLGEKWEDLKKTAADIWNAIKTGWDELPGKVVQFVADVKNSATEWWNDVKRWWAAKVESVKSFTVDVKNDASTWWQNVKDWWKFAIDPNTIEMFKVSVKNEAGTWWSNVKKWWGERVNSTNIKAFAVDVRNRAATWWHDVKEYWNEFVTDFRTLPAVVSIVNNISSLWESIQKWWNDTVGDLWLNIKVKLPHFYLNWGYVDTFLGRIDYPTSLGVEWYAKGGIMDGAMLFGMMGDKLLGGGEAGKEAILPLETHTEWMDTLADRVNDGDQRSDIDLAESVRLGVMEATARQNDLLRQQNEYLRQLLEKPLEANITSNAIVRAMQLKNKRDGTTVVPVY